MLKNVDTLEREQGNTPTAPMSQILTQAPFRIEGIENINEVNPLFLQYSKFLLKNVDTLEREQGNTPTALMSQTLTQAPFRIEWIERIKNINEVNSLFLQYSKFLLKNVDTLEREQGNTPTAPMSQILTQAPFRIEGIENINEVNSLFYNILNFCQKILTL